MRNGRGDSTEPRASAASSDCLEEIIIREEERKKDKEGSPAVGVLEAQGYVCVEAEGLEVDCFVFEVRRRKLSAGEKEKMWELGERAQ